VESRVTWTGMITGAEKWGALHSAEVFLLPSHQENFGIAVAEALAAGVPTLISNKVNIWREILADGAGMVSDDTLEGACTTLRSYNDLPAEERITMRQAARACFDRRFEISTAARSLHTVLSNFSGVN
jgi:glycosyltransferase involved in cell wall biosynthesis